MSIDDDSAGTHNAHSDHNSPSVPCSVAQPAIYAGRAAVALHAPACSSTIEASLAKALVSLTASLEAAGCTLIGHIKGVADAGHQGQLFFSITRIGDEPHFRGTLNGPVADIVLTINVICYGLGDAAVRRAVDESLAILPGVRWP